jgi:hypothetical protein
MSLRDLAIQRLAILRGETGGETSGETMKQATPVFHPKVVGNEPGETRLSRFSADAHACFTVPIPKQRNSETKLPSEMATGLALLRRSSAPVGLNAAIWRGVVADALRLADDGWAANALGLGWAALDLFGASVDPEGDPDADGLAARLCGRRVLAICSSFATVEDDSGGRCYLYRGDTSATRLLWALGRGR